MHPLYDTLSVNAIAIRLQSSSVFAVNPTGKLIFSSGCSLRYSSVTPGVLQQSPFSTTSPIENPCTALCDQPYHLPSFKDFPIEQTSSFGLAFSGNMPYF